MKLTYQFLRFGIDAVGALLLAAPLLVGMLIWAAIKGNEREREVSYWDSVDDTYNSL